MSPLRPNLQSLVASTIRSVRRDTFFALAGAVAALGAAALLIAWALSGFERWPAPSPWPLLLELSTIVLAVSVSVLALRRLRGASSERHIAAAGEQALGLPEGSVRGVLELSRDIPVGTSPVLYQSAQARLDSLVNGVDGRRFGGTISRSVRRRRAQTLAFAAVLVIAAVSVALVSPTRSRAGWAPLLHPVAHLSPPPLPLMSVEPGNADVPRGGSLAVRIRAPQRDNVLLEWRAAGSVPRSETVSMTDGAGAGTITSIDATVRYWVTAPDGAVSDTFTVQPTDPLLVADLAVEVVYPSYLSRPAEQFQSELPSLEVPEGTELRIHGRATRALGKAGLQADSGRTQIDLKVDGTGFEGRWLPRISGFYEWRLLGPSGVRAELVPAPFELVIVPDQPPEIEVTYPGVDTTLTADLLQTIVADARDDHGLLEAVLVSWRTSSTGQKDAPVEQPVTLEGEADRAAIRGMLDVRDRHLLPGDTLSYFIRVTDNSPRRQTTVSQTYRLRLPSMEELRQEAGDQADDLQKQIDQVAQAARDLEKQTRDLNRRSAAESQTRAGQGKSQGNPGDKQMDFEKAEQTRSLVERQEQMLNQVEQMRDRIKQLEKAMEQAGLRDPDLQKRLQEMRELYDKMLTPELRKKLEELKQNVDKMDPEQMQKALEQLSKQQEEFREQLERSLELMRRAAAEQEMNKLAQEAKELATQQQAVADQMKQQGDKTSKEKSEQQKDLSEKTDSLNKALQQLMQRLEKQGEGKAAQKTGSAQDKAEQASDQMKQAAEQAAKQQSQQAAQTGEKAAEKLNDAAKTIEDARKQMADGWKQEVQDAMDKATNDALSLAKKQNELLEQMKDMQAGKQPPQQGQQQQGQQQQGQQQQGQQQAGQQQQGQQQAGQQGQKQAGQQQQGQQQAGQQGQKQQGQQQGSQQQGGQQGKQQGAQQQGSQQQGGKPQQTGQQGQQQGGQQQGQQGGQQQQGQAGGQNAGGQADANSIKSEQSALKQGVEQLGQNLQEAGQKSAMMNREVGSALGRANMSMEQTLKGLEQGRMPTQEAAQSLDALNRLALELLKNSQQMQDAQSGTGLQQALEQLAELAKQQGGVNGQSSSLAPMNLAPQVMSDQLSRLAKEQRDIAQKLDGMQNMGGREDALGRLDELAKEANDIAREMQGGRLTPQTLARQEKLFHRLLDAGRTLERDEYSEERKAERAGSIPPHIVKGLKPGLLEENQRYRVPSEAELAGYPPALRRQIIEFFQRINQSAATNTGKDKQ